MDSRWEILQEGSVILTIEVRSCSSLEDHLTSLLLLVEAEEGPPCGRPMLVHGVLRSLWGVGGWQINGLGVMRCPSMAREIGKGTEAHGGMSMPTGVEAETGMAYLSGPVIHKSLSSRPKTGREGHPIGIKARHHHQHHHPRHHLHLLVRHIMALIVMLTMREAERILRQRWRLHQVRCSTSITKRIQPSWEHSMSSKGSTGIGWFKSLHVLVVCPCLEQAILPLQQHPPGVMMSVHHPIMVGPRGKSSSERRRPGRQLLWGKLLQECGHVSEGCFFKEF